MSNANARKERYASAVEVFFQDGRQRLIFCRFTCVKQTQMQAHLRWGGLHEQFLAFAFAFVFAEVLLVSLIDLGRCGY